MTASRPTPGPLASGCPMDWMLRLVMGRWTAYILWVLATEGPLRFGALGRQVPGISAKVLTQRLRALAEAGLVHRDYNPTVPPEVTYSLTERGRELRPVLESLYALAVAWRSADQGPVRK